MKRVLRLQNFMLIIGLKESL